MANTIITIDEHLDRIENAKNTLGDKAQNMGLVYTDDEGGVKDITPEIPIEQLADAFDDIPIITAEEITVKDNKVNIPAGYRGQDTEVSISTSGKTATATVEGKSITANVDDGSYKVTTSDATVQNATVDAEGTNITLTEEEGSPVAGTTDAFIKVSGNVDAIVTATATIEKAGYIEAGSKSTDELVEVSTTPKYYRLNNGTVDLSGGGLSKGAGSAGATITGANFSLTESTTQPASGKKYITATGSGSVIRDAIGYKTTSGFVGNTEVDGEDLADNNLGDFGVTTLESNTATKYYTIPDTVVDTQSGTAVASDILKDKKAWVGGQELTGGMTNHGAVETSVKILDDNGNTPTHWTLGDGYVSGVSLQFDYTNLLNRLAAI